MKEIILMAMVFLIPISGVITLGYIEGKKYDMCMKAIEHNISIKDCE
jgi:hypothetical protein